MTKRIFLIILIFSVMFFTGCALDRKSVAENSDAVVESEESNPESFTDIDELTSGNFYVLHDGIYYGLYLGNTNFSNSSSQSASNICWFSDENFGFLPTLYSGDMLIYYSDEPFSESFCFDRYEYIGYTLGVSGFKSLSSGRYSFNASSDNENINPSSDAHRLCSLDCDEVTVESIGGSKLRKGNISDGSGVILGLKGGSYYKTELYVGSVLQSYTLCADSIALSYMESTTSDDYSFLKSTVIRINVPEYFNSGYYIINGVGMFRYVNGDSYDNTTDFNVENEPVKNESQTYEKQILNSEDDAVMEIPFTIKKETNVNIYIKYEEISGLEYTMEVPAVKILGKANSYTLNEDNGVFNSTLHLPSGHYKIKITGLNGRAYEYLITDIGMEEE